MPAPENNFKIRLKEGKTQIGLWLVWVIHLSQNYAVGWGLIGS